MARQNGELVQWNDARGFGFIASDDGERRFVHISDIGRIATRPRVGDRVSFAPGRGTDGRPAAREVRIAGANPLNREANKRGAPVARSSPSGLPLAVAAIIVLLATAAWVLGSAPFWLPVAYLALGVVSIVTYWFDKRAAEAGRWRVRETSLHIVDAIGGIAGGLVAQQLLRHKTSKRSFIGATALIAVVHLVALATLCLGLWDLR
jgi:uncharacterized membrane protein YsdA (DUF1294 family)/cold shock CspA family protein